MAESVDALVSNTNGVTPVPVRPRLWVQKTKRKALKLNEFWRFFYFLLEYCWKNFIELSTTVKPKDELTLKIGLLKSLTVQKSSHIIYAHFLSINKIELYLQQST